MISDWAWDLVTGLVCAVGAAAGESEPAGPPSSAYLEAESCRAALFTAVGDEDELLLRLKARASQLAGMGNEKEKLTQSIKRNFHQSLRVAGPQEGAADGVDLRRLFAAGPRQEKARAGLVDTLDRVGARIDSTDVEQMLPAVEELPTSAFGDLRSEQFAGFASKRWGPKCTGAILTRLADGRVVGAPEWFLGLLWLGLHAFPPADQPGLVAALDRAYLRRPKGLAEPEIATLYRPVCREPWGTGKGEEDAVTAPVRNHLLTALAGDLFQQAVQEIQGELNDSEYLDLAARQGGSTDWSRKLARQLKPAAGRNERARRLLGRFVAQGGDHFSILAGETRDDVDFFIYLHTCSGETVEGPWNIVNRKPGNLKRSIGLLKQLLDVERRDKWSVALLDLLARDYYGKDPTENLFESILRPIVQSRRVSEEHPVREELLARVLKGTFPLDWRERWTLAWDATQSKKLLDEIPITGARISAVALLSQVCQGLPLPDARDAKLLQVNETYGKLLQHIYWRLFETAPPDAKLDHETVVSELTDLFRRLAGLRKSSGWKPEEFTCIRGFWEHVEAAFTEAARRKQRPQMAAMLRLMLRICAVLADPEPVRRLADTVCSKVFDVTPTTPFRVLEDKVLAEQVGLFAEIAPAIRDAIDAVKADAPAAAGAPDAMPRRKRFLDEIEGIIDLFQANLYLPLLRTNLFLARAATKDNNPWLQLIDAHVDAGRKEAAFKALLEQLTAMKFLNAPAQTLSLVRRCHTELGIRIWFQPDRVTLSENVNAPLVKQLLDDNSHDLTQQGSKPGPVLDLFLAALGQESMWIESCDYNRSGERLRVSVFDRLKLAAYLAGLLAFHEARVAPFRRGNDEAFDPAGNEAGYSYHSEAGPAFSLPEGRWDRRGVPGKRRRALFDALWELRRSGDWSQHLDLAEIALLLPNRASHVAAADLADLDAYAKLKEAVVGDLERAASEVAEDAQRFGILQALARFRYSFGERARAESAAFRAAEEQLRKHSQPLGRALYYEDIFLRLANPQPGERLTGLDQRVALVIELLRNEHKFGDLDDPSARAIEVEHRNSRASAYLASVSQADIIALHPLMQALTDRKDGPQGREIASRIFWTYALALPFYGIRPEQLLAPTPGAPAEGAAQRLDRVILFCQLATAGKARLARWAVEEQAGLVQQAGQAQLRQLLVEHNNVAMVLAGMVFEDRALLAATQKPTPYTAETIDFAILYHRRKKFDLDARELLDGAVKGCEQNFELARHGMAAAEGDESVVALLFTGIRWSADPQASVSPSLDAVLRTCARVARDPRYEADPDPDLVKAAKKFQAAASDFVAKPRQLVWFQKENPKSLQHAVTYFLLCEMAGESILEGSWPPWRLPGEPDETQRQRAERWERDARAAHAILWQRLLLGEEGAPPWAAPFIRCFCERAPADHAEGPPVESLKAQRGLMERLAAGEAEEPAAPVRRRLKGLSHTLATLARLERGGPNSPAVSFLSAYWKAAQALLHAAQLGEGLPASTPFLAQPFLAEPGGFARPLDEAEIAAAVKEREKNWLFDALDWPNRWDDKFQSQPLLRDLVGPPLESVVPGGRRSPGLGSGSIVPEREKPTSYRPAAWLAMSGYIAKALRNPLEALEKSCNALRLAPPTELVQKSWGEQESVCTNVLRVIQRRIIHNEAMATLQGVSEQLAQPPGPSAHRTAAWAWLGVDRLTIEWAKGLVTNNPWAHPAPLWMPFGVHAGLDDPNRFFEPPALGLTETAWEATDADPQVQQLALLHLLSLGELPQKTRGADDLRLSDGCATTYRKLLDSDSSGPKAVAHPEACRKKLLEWTYLRSWLPLLDPAKRKDIAGYGGAAHAYRFDAIRSEAIEQAQAQDIGGLGQTAIDLCCWRALPSEDWVVRYRQKMALVSACGQACSEQAPKGDGSWVPALTALYELACRAEPCASPFTPRYRKGRVYLTEAPGAFWPAGILKMDGAKRAAALKLLRTWCLLQRVVQPDGQLETLKAGYMGYVDLLMKENE